MYILHSTAIVPFVINPHRALGAFVLYNLIYMWNWHDLGQHEVHSTLLGAVKEMHTRSLALYAAPHTQSRRAHRQCTCSAFMLLLCRRCAIRACIYMCSCGSYSMHFCSM